MRPGRHLLLGILAITLSSCGPEREHSGVWRMASCGDDTTCADGFVYELHIGRYGDGVAGVVVRYQYQGAELDSFQRQHECGCFLIQSGVASDTRLRFELFEPDVPRLPDDGFLSPEPACRPPPPACGGQRFLLDGDGDTLRGEMRCGGATGGTTVNFEKAGSRPRTTCVCPGAGDPDRQCQSGGDAP